MIRRLLSTFHGGYTSGALLRRNVAKWWSRRSGWVVCSLILDELLTLRCFQSLEGGAA